MNDSHKANAQSAKEIFFAALEQPTVEARAAFLDGACRNNPVLRPKIDKLLADHFEEDTFLKTAAVEGLSTVMESTPVTEGPGTQIDRYKLLQRLGEGGFGVVYMAEQKEPVKRRVALKIIKLGMDTRQVVARFEAERQALAMMDHPNIAKVLDAGATATGRPYFVMELVKGVPVTKYCDDNNLTTKERLELFIPVCQAIQHAHQKGIIHRDIKPSNVMITLHDGQPVPKVIDFGIAKATQAELTEKTIFTQYSQFIGTPAYMSPEQAEMSGLDVDTRSDIYSLGVLLYELLVGRTPLDAKALMSGGYDEIRRRIKEEEPPKPSTRVNTMEGSEKTTVARHRKIGPDQLSSELRGDLDWIVLKALEKDRTRRYETANGIALDIQRFLKDEPVSAVAPSKGYLIRKYVRRHRTALALAATIAGLLLSGATLSTWQAVRATRAQRIAEAAKSEALEQKLLAQEKQSEAETERQNAEEARQREQALREEAVASERRQRLSAYEADMRLAHRYLSENNLAMVKMLLDRYDRATNGFPDVRGLYWRHLHQVTQGDQSSSTLPHDSMVRSVSLSSDGGRLASCTLSGRVRLYEVTKSNDVNTTKLLWEHGGGFLAYGAEESSVAVSPDGRLLAAEQQGTLKVWNTATGELSFEQVHVRAPVMFSPDSTLLVGVSDNGLMTWNTLDWSAGPRLDRSGNVDTRQTSALTFTSDGSM
jgi:eukaryotic-like serine/threonine-protein kinase